MRALVHDPAAPHGLRLGEAPDAGPGPSEALVEVSATSINFADVAFLHERFEPGAVPGFDAAGTVVAAAADGSGPAVGARVATFGWSGAWAERRAVETAELAVLRDGVDLGAAAAVPVAGVTALRALRRLGPLLGRRVLITGAAGGVAHALLRPGGCVLSVGMASLEPTTIDFEAARMHAADTRIEAFVVGSGFGEDLSFLVSLLEAGQLDPQIGWRGGWDRASEAAASLMGRQVRGKVVLEIAP